MENKLNIGELDTKITVQAFTETRGSEGEVVKTWTDHSTPFAKVERQTTELVNSENLEEREVLTVTMYKIASLTTRWRIKVGSQAYEISEIDPVSRISPLCILTVHAIDK